MAETKRNVQRREMTKGVGLSIYDQSAFVLEHIRTSVYILYLLQ